VNKPVCRHLAPHYKHLDAQIIPLLWVAFSLPAGVEFFC
jgi:hypothetical protein